MTPISPAAIERASSGRRGRSGGFSLVEILISLFILTLTIHALGLSVFSVLRIERDALRHFKAERIFLTLTAGHWAGERSLDGLAFEGWEVTRREIKPDDEGGPVWVQFRLREQSMAPSEAFSAYVRLPLQKDRGDGEPEG